MPYTDLRDWIKTLDRADELKHIKEPISPHLEMAEIADRTAKLGKGTAKAGGPALLFANVIGHPGARVLMNQFGSEARMKLALNVDSLDAIADRIRILLHPVTPVTMLDKLKLLPKLAEVGSFFPKVISREDARCKEVIHKGKDVDLNQLPILQTWPQDGGRFITLPCVITRDPNPASATSACTACRCTTARPPECTGSARRSPPSTCANSSAPLPPDKASAVDSWP